MVNVTGWQEAAGLHCAMFKHQRQFLEPLRSEQLEYCKMHKISLVSDF